jgi:hypothetical protein
MNQRVEQRKSGVAHAACEVQVPRTYMYLPESKCSYCETDTHTLDNCKRMMTLISPAPSRVLVELQTFEGTYFLLIVLPLSLIESPCVDELVRL